MTVNSLKHFLTLQCSVFRPNQRVQSSHLPEKPLGAGSRGSRGSRGRRGAGGGEL